MTLADFVATLQDSTPPPVNDALRALWHDAQGDWEAAHGIAQEIRGRSGSWVHAYLHRKEGDQDNAAYWYRRADKPVASGPLDAEWNALVTTLLAPHQDD
jgi:hypothetical protein